MNGFKMTDDTRRDGETLALNAAHKYEAEVDQAS